MSQVKLGDVAVESRETYKGDKTGMPIVGLEHIIPGEVTLSNWDTDTDNTFTKRFRKGDMLFGRRRAYLKKAAQAPFDGICSGDITVIRAKEDLLLPELLPFVIQNDNLFDFAVGKSAGSLSPRVKWDNLKNYTFELPPMEEQRRLAEVLWSINDTLQAYQKLLIETDALVQAQFVEMFDNASDGDYIPLEKCCASIQGGSTPSMKHDEYYGGNIPFIKSGDVKDEYVSSGALWLTEKALKNTTAKYVPEGTVIVVVRSGILKNNLPVSIASNPVVINQDLKAFIPKPEFTSQYLAWAIRSNENKLLSMTRAMTVDNIESRELYSLPIKVAPIDLQHTFEFFVEQADKSKSALQNTITSLQDTKRCILEGALEPGRKE